MSENRKAGVYARLSVYRDGSQSESTDRQTEDGRRLASERGLQIARVYTDKDISASVFTNRVRPEYEQMLGDLRAGVITDVIGYDISRLTRKGLAGVVELIEAIKRAGGSLHLVHGQIDTSTPLGESILGMLGAVAAEESRATSRRVARFHQSRAEKGKLHNGGSKPFGHHRDGSLDDEQAQVIRRLVAWILEGVSRNECARRLNLEGVTTSTGRPWSSSSVGMLLAQPRLAGYRTYKGTLYRSDEIVPAISHPEFLALQAALGKSAAQVKTEVEGLLLRGLLRCGYCEAVLRYQTATIQGKKFPRWACSPSHPKAVAGRGCGRITLGVEKADVLVRDAICDALAKARLLPLEEPPSHKPDLEALKRVEQERLDAWDTAYLEGALSPQRWTEGRAGLVEKLASLEADLRAAEVEEEGELPPVGCDPLEWWLGASPEKRRRAVVASVTSVTVYPHNDPEKDRIVPHWRFKQLARIAAQADPDATNEL